MRDVHTDTLNQIRTIINKVGLPLTYLQMVTEATLTENERWYDNDHCPNGRLTWYWIHDGTKRTVEEEQIEERNGYFVGGGTRTIELTNASYAIRITQDRSGGGGGIYSRPTQVLVWPHCDPTKLADKLAAFLYGGDAEYLDIHDAEGAYRWIDKRFVFHPEDVAWYGEKLPGRRPLAFRQKGAEDFTGPCPPCVRIEFSPGGTCLGENGISNLVNRFGMEVLKGLYEDKKEAFDLLYNDIEAAEDHILRNFEMRKTPLREGAFYNEDFYSRERRMMFLARRKGGAQWVGPTFEQGGWVDYFTDLHVLLEKHGDLLRGRLFDQAQE